MITIVDYGLGNIYAFANIYRQLGIPCSVAKDANSLVGATHLVLPGVGAFDWAMQRLDSSGMRPALDDLVLGQKVPVLGICVGMQMMADRSDEGSRPGLGWIPGDVVRFDNKLLSAKIQLPHMGWNDISTSEHHLFDGIVDPRFYFLHSYFIKPDCPDVVVARSNYGHFFTASVASGNIMGVQFHPEKSHNWGVCLLRNFSEI